MLTDPALGFAVTAGKRGTVQFQTPGGGRISALGIRAAGRVITTIPVLATTAHPVEACTGYHYSATATIHHERVAADASNYTVTIAGTMNQDMLGTTSSYAFETNAAVDWALYYGVQIGQYEFQYKLPSSDNPNFGFVGNVNSPWGQVPPYAYGVYAGPIADLLNQYHVQARAVKNYSLEEVKQLLARDNPVIAWVIGNMVGGIPAEYTDSQGRKTVVAAYEHVVILTGYNESTQRIRYLNNDRFFEIPYSNFLNSWKVLGNMAVVKD